MTLLISDANILIDIEIAELTREMFQLPETFAVPDILFLEELVEHHHELPGYGLQVMQLAAEVVEEANQLRARYIHPSMNDLFALALAKHVQCPLLSGDGRLRNAASQEQVSVRGTLWLLESLVQHEIINLGRLEKTYELLRTENRRLPWDEVTRQLNRLRK
ncbi:MAG: PIN domain-containing protein [Nitrososphaerales archaeon]